MGFSLFFSYPSRKIVSELIYKKGFANLEGKRIQINNNELIEKELGKFGMLCIEDLVHEIVKAGPNFEEAIAFIWYFLRFFCVFFNLFVMKKGRLN